MPPTRPAKAWLDLTTESAAETFAAPAATLEGQKVPRHLSTHTRRNRK